MNKTIKISVLKTNVTNVNIYYKRLFLYLTFRNIEYMELYSY